MAARARAHLVPAIQKAAPDMATTRLTIDVWADVLCPWCYIGEHRLARAIAQSPHANDIDLTIHTFELDPAVPATVQPTLDYRTVKYGITRIQARAMETGVAGQAAAEGLPYTLDRPVSNTFAMLRLVHLGNEHGVGWQYMRAMQAELYGGNPDAFGHGTLTVLGERLGLPAEEIRDVLTTDRYSAAVRADHAAAVASGASGVPFTVLGRRLGIPGAATVRQYTAAIDQAWDQLNG
ncbi:DsbA family protein [Actinoplanes sp. NPDC026670]|uniref:DsbA family oxidoreductase n=1 Tax=Actinoplanes sp. NPDC026670 TaxID=3154700 RepID=UPI0033C4E071